MDSDDVYRWLDGTLVASGFTKWLGTEPSHKNQNYIRFRSDWNGQWTDYAETYYYKYICESGLI